MGTNFYAHIKAKYKPFDHNDPVSLMYERLDDDPKVKELTNGYVWNNTYYKDIEDFYERTKGGEYFYFSTKAPRCYTDIAYPNPCYLIFGKESAGIPESILKKNLERTVRIPMRDGLRSLNLSNSAAIAVYEVLRQRHFEGLEEQGFLSVLYDE